MAKRPGKRTVTAGMKVVAYLRVSTEKQAEEGVSLDVQRARCAAWCEATGYELVETVVDGGVSAKTLDRPGLKKALTLVGGGAKRGESWGLLVMKLDRLTRSVRDLGDLVDRCEREGWYMLSITESIDTSSANGRMMVNMITLFSQWERETISERTRVAMAHKQEQGEYIGGGVPFGLALVDGGKVEPKEEEQTIIHRARAIRAAAPSLSLRAIGDRLHQEGLRPRNGGPWAAQQVKRLLTA